MKSVQAGVLAALALCVSTAVPAAAPKSVRDGITAWQKGDYVSAVATWRPLAEQGNADAAFNLGQAYRLGRGVAVDLSKSKYWLEKAAVTGHLDAQTTLGLLLFDSGSREAAMQWLKKAAEQGEPRAMLVYGTALFNGDGVPRDPAMAYAYVSRAAAQGLDPAKSTLAELNRILPTDVRNRGTAIAHGNAAAKSGAAPKSVEAQTSAANRPTTKAATAGSGSWRVQLGAFSQRGSAEALYRKLSRVAPVAGHPAFYVRSGAVTRLQVGGFVSRAAAATACSTLAAKGQACFPVDGR